ncbi:uncharacterized protein LOC135345937 isoform X2 [Halichondria panicea]|uniref:uncharacterized protein LOC135345937 isoform X2 n=1 Tax=Halichondria panicea TaxID=6063 RepID=UPI00312B328A
MPAGSITAGTSTFSHGETTRMESRRLLFAIYAMFLLSTFAQGLLENVRCGHQQEKCVCSTSATECSFELDVEELQTFTSYELQNGDVTRGIPGHTYYLDNNAFTPSINCEMNGRSLPECSQHRCSINNHLSLSDFPLRSCSMPMTVDGSTYRLFIAVNGRIPGPDLVVTEGQLVMVNVTNNLRSEGITIHWHGMHQNKSSWMDGVAFISQPPIVPGAKFTYIFEATPPGTHWYHSHAGAQRTDGLFGALIVQESVDKRKLVSALLGVPLPDSTKEHTLTFLDWQRESSLNLFVQLHSALGSYPNKPVGEIPTSANTLYLRTRSSDYIEVGPQPYWSGLINGRGRHRKVDSSFAPSKLSIFNVVKDQRYRFRLIGAQSLFAYKFSIDGHKLLVIASDGHFFKPVKDVDYVIVHTGERYDVIVTADQSTNNYWIRAETLETGVENAAEAILHYNALGVLDVEGLSEYGSVSTSKRQCTPGNKCKVVNCPFGEAPDMNCIHLHELSALFPSKIQSIANSSSALFFNFGFEGSGTTSAINGRNFKLPVTPYQTYVDAYENDKNIQRGCGKCDQNSDSTKCECTYVVEIGNSLFDSENIPTIIFVLSAVGYENNNNREFSHPVHLHGHSFNVLSVEHGKYNESTGMLLESNCDVVCNNELCRNPRWNSTKEPPDFSNTNINMKIQKDTVIVPAGGYVVIAFQADNPGYWFMHCHIESHQLEGMGVIIREYDESAHVAAPDGINKVGDFVWSVEDYKKIVGTPGGAVSIYTIHIGATILGVAIALVQISL